MRHFGLSGAAAEELKKTVQELLLTWQTQESEREYTQGLNELMALCLQKRTKEEAFARFKELVSKLHPGFLRTNGSMAEPVDMAVCAVFEMLMKKSKVLTDHLHRVDMHFYLTGFMPGWFLSMFASEFAWPASEHLCNRLLEGEAIDRLVPQLVAAAILRSATEIVKLEDADDLIRVLKGSLSEVRTGQDLEALVKEIEEPVEPTLPPEVAEVGSFLVKTVGSGKAGKAKPKTKTARLGPKPLVPHGLLRPVHVCILRSPGTGTPGSPFAFGDFGFAFAQRFHPHIATSCVAAGARNRGQSQESANASPCQAARQVAACEFNSAD